MKKILMILTMALAATSCMDILDVAPEDQIASENMWTTEELADKGMAGLYYPFYATQPIIIPTTIRWNCFRWLPNLPMTFRCGMNGSSVTPSSMRVTMRLSICIKRI